jgi:uncharacterized protein (TIRG00374 family)
MNRRVLFWIVIGAFLVFLLTRLSELQGFIDTLARGRWEWVLVAALLQVVYFTLFSLVYREAFVTVGIKYRVRDLVPVILGSIFVSGVTPAGEAGGFAMIVEDARRRGASPASATAGSLLAQLDWFLALAATLFVGFGFLIATRDLRPFEWLGAVLVVLILGIIILSMVVGSRRPSVIEFWLVRAQRVADWISERFRKQPALPDDWAEHTTEEFRESSSLALSHPKQLLWALVIALAAMTVNIGTLAALFVAFGEPVDFAAIIAAFSVSIALWSVLPFQGIGVVEAALIAVLGSFGIEAGTATIISLAFRGLTFWIPLFLGFVTLRRTAVFKSGGDAVEFAKSGKAVARLTAVLVAIAGVLSIASALTPSIAQRVARIPVVAEQLQRFYPLIPSYLQAGSAAITALLGVALIVSAWGLWRRNMTAWFAAFGVLIVLTFGHLIKGFDVEESIVSLIVALWLIVIRPAFTSASINGDTGAQPAAPTDPICDGVEHQCAEIDGDEEF